MPAPNMAGRTSQQTLSQDDRRLAAAWAADCAERVLSLFEASNPGDRRPHEDIARARTFASDEISASTGIGSRFEGGGAIRAATTPAAKAAAHAAGQAGAVCHMGAHALGAAAYAVRAAALAAPDNPTTIADEIRWQIKHASVDLLHALNTLPPIGQDRSGPLGPGRLATGEMGKIIKKLQAGIQTRCGSDSREQVTRRGHMPPLHGASWRVRPPAASVETARF